MSSNGVKVKQQFSCLLNLSIKLKGTTFFLFFPPKKPFHTKLLNTKPSGKLKMLKKIRFFSQWLLTPNSRQDYNCQNISQASKNIYIYIFNEEYFNIYFLNQNFFSLLLHQRAANTTPIVHPAFAPSLFHAPKKTPFNVTRLQQHLSNKY